MKKIFFCTLLFTCSVSLAQQCPIIPFPNQYTSLKGIFNITDNTPIIIEGTSLASHAHYLQHELLKKSGDYLKHTAKKRKTGDYFNQNAEKEKRSGRISSADHC